jgi:hypothetical protein
MLVGKKYPTFSERALNIIFNLFSFLKKGGKWLHKVPCCGSVSISIFESID